MIDSFEGHYRFLSNFYPSIVDLDGVEYPTVEHAYQAAKTTNPDHRELVRMATTPGKAKRLGRDLKMRMDWPTAKFDVMFDLLQQKFSLKGDLWRDLERTHPHELVEGNTSGDTCWGVCRGRGDNRLGNMLMQIRETFVL